MHTALLILRIGWLLACLIYAQATFSVLSQDLLLPVVVAVTLRYKLQSLYTTSSSIHTVMTGACKDWVSHWTIKVNS